MVDLFNGQLPDQVKPFARRDLLAMPRANDCAARLHRMPEPKHDLGDYREGMTRFEAAKAGVLFVTCKPSKRSTV
jgi:hypothetical protein